MEALGWFVYMLRCADGTLYTGMTDNVAKRFAAHAAGRGAKYTRGRGPLELVYTEELPDRSAALKREYAIKQMGRGEKLALMATAGKQKMGSRCEDMRLETDRLILRPWAEADAESLYEYAKDPAVGPMAGWPPHQSVSESLEVIRRVLNGPACYAVCEKGSGRAIGSVELKMKGRTDMTDREDECELGYWIGKPFWGRGYMPEAAGELLRYGFETLGMTTVWCGYYDGNNSSKRVQEKLGFVYHHTCREVEVPLMKEIRVGHTSVMTRDRWEALRSRDR